MNERTENDIQNIISAIEKFTLANKVVNPRLQKS